MRASGILRTARLGLPRLANSKSVVLTVLLWLSACCTHSIAQDQGNQAEKPEAETVVELRLLPPSQAQGVPVDVSGTRVTLFSEGKQVLQVIGDPGDLDIETNVSIWRLPVEKGGDYTLRVSNLFCWWHLESGRIDGGRLRPIRVDLFHVETGQTTTLTVRTELSDLEFSADGIGEIRKLLSEAKDPVTVEEALECLGFPARRGEVKLADVIEFSVLLDLLDKNGAEWGDTKELVVLLSGKYDRKSTLACISKALGRADLALCVEAVGKVARELELVECLADMENVLKTAEKDGNVEYELKETIEALRQREKK